MYTLNVFIARFNDWATLAVDTVDEADRIMEVLFPGAPTAAGNDDMTAKLWYSNTAGVEKLVAHLVYL